MTIVGGSAAETPDTDSAARGQRDPWEHAVERSAEAVERYRLSGDATRQAQALARRAEALQQLGHRSRATADLEAATVLLRDTADARLRAAVLAALGQAYQRSGDLRRAEAHLRDALGIARAEGLSGLVAAIRNDQGIMRVAATANADAHEAFLEAQTLARAAGDHAMLARALLNAARLHLRQGQNESAVRGARAAIAASERITASRERALQLAGAGDLLRRLAKRDGYEQLRQEALAALTASARVAEETKDWRVGAYAWGFLASFHEDVGRTREALDLNARALFDAQRGGSREGGFYWQWQRARLLDRDGRVEESLAAYRKALAALSALKTDFAADLWAEGQSFRERIGPAYLGYVDLLLRRAAASADGEGIRSALREAQTVLEGFKAVELEDYFQDDCIAQFLALARPLEQLAPHTAVIYPVPLQDRLELIVSIGDVLQQHTVPVGLEELQRAARELRARLENRLPHAAYLPIAKRLYDWIIRPLAPMLSERRIDTIVFVPDEPLRGVPLAALHDGADFVVARYAVANAPGLTLVDPRPIAVQTGGVLAAGVTESVQGFPALPGVAAELEEISGAAPGTTLIDNDFTTASLERALRSRDHAVVHLATHARFDGDSRRSFVLTYDGRVSIGRLEESIKLGRYRKRPLEMLFLSACQTAVGDERAALGLAGVALKAGASSALATLWQINDQSTSVLVTEFYRQLGAPGATRAKALQRAQLALMRDPGYSHPFFWAAFLVIGNWM